MDAVTGAFSYLGSYIARALLDRGRDVLTLSRRRDPAHPLAGAVAFAPLQFGDPAALAGALHGVDTLYNTYWVRFPRGRCSWDDVLANTRTLQGAAQRAGVRRVVQISVSNSALDSPWGYFRAKAVAERDLLAHTAFSHAIVRPTLIFGAGDILVNNIAWVLRRLALFVVAGDGAYRVQPVAAAEVARLAVAAGARDDAVALDAGGPDVLRFDALVALVRSAIGARSAIVHVPPAIALALAAAAGVVLRDTHALLTRVELETVMANMLVTATPGGGQPFAAWLSDNADGLGARFVSERRMNWR
jgi:NADH dehydrogenase